MAIDGGQSVFGAMDAARKDDLAFKAMEGGYHRTGNTSLSRARTEGPSKTDYEPKYIAKFSGESPRRLAEREDTAGNKLSTFHGHVNKTADIEKRADTYGKLQAAKHLGEAKSGTEEHKHNLKKYSNHNNAFIEIPGRYNSPEEHEKKFGHL
jgi:hypothetical protein